jgi:hypothetical protein
MLLLFSFSETNLDVFVLGYPFQLGLIFAGKPMSYWKMLHSGSTCSNLSGLDTSTYLLRGSVREEKSLTTLTTVRQ